MKNLFATILLVTLALPVISRAETTAAVYANAGVPSSGTSEIDTLTIGGTPTGGSFTITVTGGRTTAPINWTATDATLVARVDAALEALSVIGVGGVTTAAGSLSSGIGTITITFTGKNARSNFAALSVSSSLTGSSPTLAVATTTAGVAATFPTAATGALLVDTSTPGLYINTSTTAGSPTWTIIEGNPSSPVQGQTVISSTNVKHYLTGTTGIIITGTNTTTF